MQIQNNTPSRLSQVTTQETPLLVVAAPPAPPPMLPTIPARGGLFAIPFRIISMTGNFMHQHPKIKFAMQLTFFLLTVAGLLALIVLVGRECNNKARRDYFRCLNATNTTPTNTTCTASCTSFSPSPL